jgi:uncharacterized membrane protein
MTLPIEFDERPRTRSAQIATGLGYFSLGLGLAELIAPGTMARLIGLDDTDDGHRRTLRAFGAREIANGAAILAAPDDAKWLWSRVGGDALDLAYLGAAGLKEGAEARRIAAALAVAGVTALDLFSAWQLQQRDGRSGRRGGRRGFFVEEASTINRPVEEVYAFWRRFENFPRFMRHLESVERIDDRRSRWRARAPAGTSVTWEAEITDERENEFIAWRSIEGSQVMHQGSVSFQRAPGARGTEVRASLEYAPPAGSLGRGVAWLFGEEPSQQIRDDLRRFKQLLETGEVPASNAPGMWTAARPQPARVTEQTEVHR